MKFLKNEQGSAVVVVTLALSVLIGMSALVSDVGLLYLHKNKLKALTDSAALAGAQDISSGVNIATTTAKNYALANGGKEEELEITANGTSRQLTVKARREVKLFFARIFGNQSGYVEAASTAQAASVIAANGVAPLGIEEQTLNYGQLYTLKTGSPPTIGAGNFGALILASPGADDYETFLREGFPGEIRIGQVLGTQTGNISNPTTRAVEHRINRDTRIPKNTFDNFDRNAPQIIIVPTYVPFEVSTNQIKRVQVTGFAAFFVTSVTGQGSDNFVNGYFIRTIAPGETRPTQKDNGLVGVKLIN